MLTRELQKYRQPCDPEKRLTRASHPNIERRHVTDISPARPFASNIRIMQQHTQYTQRVRTCAGQYTYIATQCKLRGRDCVEPAVFPHLLISSQTLQRRIFPYSGSHIDTGRLSLDRLFINTIRPPKQMRIR